ncbi:PEP-CTERM sorting domain-containing protein [Gemmata sp. JC673]|uniref:PEP-CTERM sorting domain-containing protein n=1 Tax=Gemmata algarum TaxID=2975278 RepID=A0ABU5F648_9BACT|nr:PEP-CTERM sorting domain-containing protein [Gemmata algarum]MDY3563050.1 PEP-CTERM sorting domain-containing protein [Gemmata algarum]
MKLRVFLLTVTLALFSGASARAGYQYQFVSGGQVINSSIQVNQGSTVDVQVYLIQTGGSDGLSTSGLNAAGVRLNYSPSGVAQVTAITPNSTPIGAFDTATTTISTGSTKYARLNLSNEPGGSGPAISPDGRVLLGTFTFSGMSVGTTTVYASDATSGIDNILANGQFLDSMINYSASTITINVVPEPGTMVLSGLLAVGIAGGAVRRFRRPATTA